MKKVEKESLLKSFLLFFFSQTLLIGALFFINYQKEVQSLDGKIFSQMRICSFDLQCKEYGIDFVTKKDQELYKLYKEDATLSSYFTIPGSQKNYLKIYLSKQKYKEQLLHLQQDAIVSFMFVLFVVAFLSFVFALYALSPLRNALHLTEEFIKDILHDFNTPLSTLRLNVAILAQKFGENANIQRAQNAVQTILNLQANLRAYLHTHAAQQEEFSLDDVIEERIELLGANFPDITVEFAKTDIKLLTNKDGFVRIVDNLLSNALKYNKKGGKVMICSKGDRLVIKDTGKGIKNPTRVFERFYKEQDRGIGIGLHIVKKLCDEMGIEIEVQSSAPKGTVFSLALASIINVKRRV
ncbi:MAG: HAMP domain-containing histidine kinase [Epsilonproteobacteria bacterium]|nr:HAMP domain-containing histidine kinase [Campylobacterota bacterium]